MATLPLKASHNEQCSVIRFLWAKGLSANATHHTVQTGPQWLSSFWANEEIAKSAEQICFWHWSAINCSSVA